MLEEGNSVGGLLPPGPTLHGFPAESVGYGVLGAGLGGPRGLTEQGCCDVLGPRCLGMELLHPDAVYPMLGASIKVGLILSSPACVASWDCLVGRRIMQDAELGGTQVWLRWGCCLVFTVPFQI